MKPIEEIDVEKLKEACKSLNEHLSEPISVIDVAVPDLIKSFTDGVESVPDDKQEALPDNVADFYNDLYEDEAAGEDETGKTEPPDGKKESAVEKKKEEAAKKKEETAKKRAAKAAEKAAAVTQKKEEKAAATAKKKDEAAAKRKEASAAKKTTTPEVVKDEYGFVVGSKNHLFAQAIKDTPLTMKEIRELPWNTSKNTHYDAYNKMKRHGQADRDESGRMSAK